MKRIKNTFERNQGSKTFTRDLSIGQSQLTKLRTESGIIVSSKPEDHREIEKYYGRLYTSSKAPFPVMNDKRTKLSQHYIANLSVFVKAIDKTLLVALQKLFEIVISNGTSPETWSRSVVVLFFKNDDRLLLQSYKPIALVIHVYKLLYLTNHICRRLD